MALEVKGKALVWMVKAKSWLRGGGYFCLRAWMMRG